MENNLGDSDILNLLDIPSDSEDGFDSDVDPDQIELYNEYRDLLEEPNVANFKELLTQRFPTEEILDKNVQFSDLEPGLDR